MASNLYDDAVEQLAESGAPVPVAPANPYDATVQAIHAGQTQALRTSLAQADGTEPDRAAEVSRLSQRTGVPAPIVDRNYDTIRRRATLEDTPYGQMLKDSPATSAFLAEPAHAAVAADDHGSLGALEWLLNMPSRVALQSINEQKFGTLSAKRMLGPLSQEEHDQLDVARYYAGEGARLGAGDSWFRNFITKGMQTAAGLIVPEAVPAVVGAGVGAIVGGGASALAGPEAIIPGAIAGARFGAGFGYTTALATSAFLTGAGGAYDRYLSTTDELGRPMDPDVAKAAALAEGAVNAGLMVVGGKIIGKTLEVGGAKLFTKDAISTALRQPTVRAALGDLVKSYGLTLTEGTALNVAMKAGEILTDELAKRAQIHGAVPGQIATGNIDLFRQPRVANADGSVSTVDSVSANIDGREVLLSRVTPDGRHLSTADAIAEFQKTGKNLGVFDSPASADTFAQQLHQDYAAGKYDRPRLRTAADVGRELAQAAAEGAESFALVGAVGPALGFVGDLRRVRQAVAAPAFFQALGEGVAQSATGKRAPEVLQRLIDAAVKDGPVETVYAPVEDWNTYWQSKAIDPKEMATAVTGRADAYDNAVKTGEDIAIPTARYATTLAATEHNAALADFLRLGDDAMSPKDAREFVARVKQTTTEPAPPESPVRVAILKQLEAAQVPAATADAYASLYESTITNLANRAGVDPTTLYESYGLTVTRPDLGVPAAPIATPAPAVAPEQPFADINRRAENVAPLGAPDGVERRAYRPMEDIAAAAALLRRENPNVDREAATMRARAAAAVDKNAIGGQSEASEQPAEPVAGEPAGPSGPTDSSGGAAEGGVPASRPRERETPVQREARRTAHVAALVDDYVASAQRLDPHVNPSDLHAEIAFRLDALAARDEGYRDSGHDPLDLLRTVASLGGISDQIEIGRGGLEGEVRRLKEGTKFGTLAGIKKVFQKKGKPLDLLLRSLQQDQRFEWIENENMLLDALDEAARHVAETDEFPGTDQLAKEVGLDPRVAWWEQSWRPAAVDLADGDAIDAGGDTSFNTDEFNQSLFDAQAPADALNDEQRAALQRKWSSYSDAVDASRALDLTGRVRIQSRTVSGGPKTFGLDLLRRAAPVDVLDTGEVQPRLPGDVGQARDANNTTPEFDTPFSLTSEVATPTTGKQRTLFQSSEPGRRGSIRFGPGNQVSIALLQRADLSTFLHESGHLFIHISGDLVDQLKTRDAATLTPQQAGLVADYHALLGELGATSRETLTTDQNETFARSFEAYLMEGKAPSAELRPVFARFRAWLIGVYRSLKNLNVQLTDPVRQVMDRLVASDDAIAHAEAEGHVEPLFTDAAMAGMSDADFATYRATVQSASDKAKDDLQTKLIRDVQREQQAWWKSGRETTRTQVATEIGDQPVYRALTAIQKGTRPDGTSLIEGQEPAPLKLAKADLIDRYSADELKALRSRQLYAADGGVSADVVAQLAGFSSGDELVKALIAAPSLKATIDAETDARMRAKHGDLLLDGKLPEQAQEAVYGVHRQEVIQAELKALTKGMVGRIIPPAEAIRVAAERRIAATRVREIRPGTFVLAARRASQRAFDLLATHQDRAGAVQAKQQELINLALFRAASTAKDAAESAVAYLRSFDSTSKRERIGKAGADYLEQIDGIRERFDLTRRTLKDIDRRTSLAKWAAAKSAATGLPVELPDNLLAEVQRVHYKDLTSEELQGVRDGVKAIEHVALFKDKLLRKQAKRELVALAAEGAASIEANSSGPRKIDIEPRLPGTQGKRDFRGWLIAHRPMLSLLRHMDGFKDGFMFENLWRPAHEARTAEAGKGREAVQELKRIYTERFAGEEHSLYDQTYLPSIDASLSLSARLAVALNYGNEGNRSRLRSSGIGNSGPLSDAKVRDILDTLSERDWAYVQKTAALIGSYKDEIGALYKRVSGVEPTWVEPTSFQTRFGEMPGWYYPIAYEGRASARALPGPEAGFADILAQASYSRFQTANGHTEARAAAVNIPLRADLGVIGEHLQQVIHDLTHREMLIDAGRILGRSEIQDSIYRHYGDQYYREIKGAFRDLAVGTMAPPDWYRVIAPLRRGASIARLAWNFATMVRHVTNITSGMVRVGEAEVIDAIPRWLGSAKDAEFSASWVTKTSDLMATRWNHRLEELASVNNEIGINRGKWAATVRDAASSVGVNPDLAHRFSDSYLYGIHKIIQMAEIPSWIAAYRKALAADGDHGRAIASADNAILDAFGGGDLLDQAGVQRSYGGKLFTTFMTYSLSLHRQNFEILSKDASVGRKMIDATMLNIVPTMLLGAIFYQVRGGKNTFAQQIAEDLFDHATGMFVFVREVAGALRHPDYYGPAALAPFGSATRLIYNTSRALTTESPEKVATAAKGAAELAGQYYGVPVFQIEKTAAGIQALSEGKTKNPSALLFGPQEAK